MKESSQERQASLAPWIWISIVVAVVAMLISPLVLFGAASCCSGRSDPTAQLLLIPAQPVLMLMDVTGIRSLFLFAIGFGLCYGFPFLVLGIIVTALRRWVRSC